MSKKKWNRRRFLGEASCAAVGASTFMSSLMHLNMINAASVVNPNSDYKALVCILLAGGNDSFNMLVPKGDPEYEEYEEMRSTLALDQNDILDLTNGINNGKTLGVHPSMPEVRDLYDQGKLAFLSNVGTLVEPTDFQQYTEQSVILPKGLFSHSDQISQWQTSIPQDLSQLGWGGRMADVLNSLNANQNLSMNISLAGVNVFQIGNAVFPFSITENGSIGINGYGGGSLFNQIRTQAVDSLLALEYKNLFELTYGQTVRTSQDSHQAFEDAINNITPLATTFTQSNPVSVDMEMIAKTIAARTELDFCRQIFFVTFGGWDHHDEVLNNQLFMLGVVSQALKEFYDATVELGVSDKVTTFTISDFGRTLSSNGNGSDHAWGGNHLILGDAVNGGQIFGTYPDLYEDNPLDVGRGRLIPTVSADEYFAELAFWFGVSSADLDMVLPNIYNFIPQGSLSGTLGIMNV